MRKFNLLFLALFVSLIAFSQQNNLVDVVYLKNGSILRGIIVEQVPNEQIKLQTSDGSVFVYQTDEIEKIVREPASTRNRREAGFNDTASRRGFIGLSLGAAIPVGDLSDLGAGATLSLVDFGYLFHPNVGIAGKWFGSGHVVDDVSYGIGGLMFGVLASTPISPKVNFEAKGLLGFGVFTASYGSETESSEAYFGYDFGVGLRINTSNKISLLTNLDYMGISDYQSVNITFGVAYRLR